jgi:signal transduction histidine kinase/CheY-like chemotaxis protein
MEKLIHILKSSLNESYKRFVLFYNTIIHTGTDNISDEIQISNIRLTNSLSLLFAVIMLLGIPTIAILINAKSFIIPVIFEFIFNVGVIYLNHKKKHVAASMTVYYLQASAITYFSLLLGENLHPHFMVIFLISIIYLIFSKDIHRKIAFSSAIIIIIVLQVAYYFKIVQPIQLSYNIEFTIQCFVIAGILVIFCFVSKPYKNNNDNIYQIKSVNQSIQAVNNSLVELNQRIQDLNNQTMHDLRNQVHNLFSTAQILQMQSKLDPNLSSLAPQLERIFYVLNDMRNDVNAKLDDAQIEAGIKEPVSKKAIDIQYLFKSIVDINNDAALKKNLWINLNIDPSFPEIIISDITLLKKITDNLLSNTIKYATTNTVIQLNLTLENSNWCLVVKNSGKAIPPEIENRIFDRFVTYKPDQSIIGTGLGLSSVHSKVNALDGQITFKSKDDEVVLKAIFPLILGHREDLPVEPDYNVNSTDIDILIADDNLMSLHTAFQLFTSSGCKVSTANNGAEVLTMLGICKKLPDAILLDHQMPIMTGLETLVSLKAHPIYRHIPVIVCTSDQGKVEALKDAGASDIIVKPFSDVKQALYIISQHLIRDTVLAV